MEGARGLDGVRLHQPFIRALADAHSAPGDKWGSHRGICSSESLTNSG